MTSFATWGSPDRRHASGPNVLVLRQNSFSSLTISRLCICLYWSIKYWKLKLIAAIFTRKKNVYVAIFSIKLASKQVKFFLLFINKSLNFVIQNFGAVLVIFWIVFGKFLHFPRGLCLQELTCRHITNRHWQVGFAQRDCSWSNEEIILLLADPHYTAKVWGWRK